MTDLSRDFDTYKSDLTRESRRAIWFLVAATLIALVLGVLAVAMYITNLQLPDFADRALRGSWENMLNIAHLSLNLAVAAALRIWYIRQDKMTTLLTHALVLEQENETAIRVLLNKKTHR
jgi:cytochrome bd-type quinol oxidase subunit 2